MATLTCLACGHDNKPGDESCAACSSSLNLKLCDACEAVNASAAQRCHSCGARFEQQVEQQAAPALAVEDPTVVMEAPPAEKSLPAMRRHQDDAPRRPKRGRAAALWVLALALVAGGAYAFYRYDLHQRYDVSAGVQVVTGYVDVAVSKIDAQVSRIITALSPAPAPAPEAVPAPVPKAVPVPVVAAPAPAPVAPPAPVAAPAPKPRAEATKPAVVAQAAPPAETKRALAPVTHTRAGAAAAAAASAAPAASVTPQANAAPVGVPRARVTHTRAPEGAQAAAVPAAAPAVAQAPIEKEMNAPACPPGVAALGLCISK